MFFSACITSSLTLSLLSSSVAIHLIRAFCNSVSFKVGECLQNLFPFSKRLVHLHTLVLLPSRFVYRTRRYIQPHSPQINRSVKANLPEYLLRPEIPLFGLILVLLPRLAISN